MGGVISILTKTSKVFLLLLAVGVFFTELAVASGSNFNDTDSLAQRIMFVSSATKTISNTAAETSTFPSGIGGLTFPANFLTTGRAIRIKGYGVYSTPAIVSSSVTIRVKLGANLLASTTTTSLITSAASKSFVFEQIIICTASGSSGTFYTSGNINYSSATRIFDDLDNAGVSVTVDTTTTQGLDVTAQWDTASASRSATILYASVEVLD